MTSGVVFARAPNVQCRGHAEPPGFAGVAQLDPARRHSVRQAWAGGEPPDRRDVSGLVAIVFQLGFVRRHTYAPFVVYRLIAAALVLLIISTGVRAASF